MSAVMCRSLNTCVRCLFCNLNAIVWLSGCGLIGTGLWLRVTHRTYSILLPQHAVARLDSVCLILGAITFLITFFGCCGSWFKNKCMLITYFTLVVLLFFTEFILGTLVFFFRDDLSRMLREELITGIEQHYGMPKSAGLQAMWTHMQNKLSCCGVRGYEDWFDIAAWPEKKYVPDSCCKPDYQISENCGQSGNPDMWHETGCSEQVQIWLMQRLHLVGTVGLVIASAQFLCMLASLLLFCSSGKRSKDSKIRVTDI
ncbi:unnamed protein product [Bemisia tabaci]|uniref:Tetraspanin n=1 Tax=Bemisia tabaci TaxID=7038 RepID=A0A9P0A3S7_BEMTA|nr:PREDICTED: tetraspanin-9 [Bemisia tabaci]CAH0383865.1 unnamed protein product [Bemisia tabaci]